MTDKDEIDYLRNRLTVTLHETRIQSAIANMQALLMNPETSKELNMARMAVVCADSLIEELVRDKAT